MRRVRDVPLLDRLVDGALLAFAASVPMSIALGQLCLAVLLLAWIGLRLAGARVLKRSPGYLEIAILCLMGGGVLACLVNRLPGQLLEVLDNHAVLLALPALAALAVERPVIYRRAIIVTATIGALVAIYAAWQHYGGVDLLRGRMLVARGDVFISKGAFSHHLTYGGSVMLTMLAALGLSHTGRSFRLMPAALLVPMALALVWSYARSAWLGAFAGTMMLIVVGSIHGSLRRLLAVTAAATVVVVAFVLVDPSVRNHIQSTLELAHDPPPRVRIWQSTLHMLQDHPLGIAPGRFETLFPDYQVPGTYHSTVHAHADVLRALTDAGPVGLVGYLLLVPGAAVLALRRLWRRRERDGGEIAAADARTPHQEHRRGAERDLLTIGLAASTSFFVAGLMQTYFWDLEDVMLWMLLVAPALAMTRVSELPEPARQQPAETD